MSIEGVHWTELRHMLAANVQSITVGVADIRISSLHAALVHVRCVGGSSSLLQSQHYHKPHRNMPARLSRHRCKQSYSHEVEFFPMSSEPVKLT